MAKNMSPSTEEGFLFTLPNIHAVSATELLIVLEVV
jgi:hypothetical protein